MENDTLLKLERTSRDRDFFLLNKDKIVESYEHFQNILSKYIDLCCLKFKTFAVNKTSYIYGSIVTLALAFSLCANNNFKSNKENALSYFARDIFPLFIEEYNTETLVSILTQTHMLKGYVSEYNDLINEETKYCGGRFDSYFKEDYPSYVKHYLNRIITYCVERKCGGSNDEDVVNELLPLLTNIF